MKKIIRAAVITVAVASMSLTAFAADSENFITINQANGSKDIPVNAKYVDSMTTPDVISADVEWGEMQFTYSVGGKKVWNPDTHTYSVENSTAGWSESGNKIKVTNHSNVNIKASFTYTKDSNASPNGSFTYENGKTATDNTVELAKGVVEQKENADFVTAALKLSGTPSSELRNFTKVGTVTVKITK